MTSRAQVVDRFLAQAGYSNQARTSLAGDASMRRYERLVDSTGHSVVLMDAPPDKNPNLEPYIHITKLLAAQRVSVPDIIAQDLQNGLLLIEDLGDNLFSNVLNHSPNQERALYEAATDWLIKMHTSTNIWDFPKLEPLTPSALSQLTSLTFNTYRYYICENIDDHARAEFEIAFLKPLSKYLSGQMVFVHRDFHVQNLLWLPKRDGIARIGVIDFQDAKLGHPAYDLVSLLQDARRDVSQEIQDAMLDRYIKRTGVNGATFRTAYALLGVQRNMRILGVFARLSKTYGKPEYVDLIPRVWKYFTQGLTDEACATFAPMLLDSLPAPTQENLQKLSG